MDNEVKKFLIEYGMQAIPWLVGIIYSGVNIGVASYFLETITGDIFNIRRYRVFIHRRGTPSAYLLRMAS